MPTSNAADYRAARAAMAARLAPKPKTKSVVKPRTPARPTVSAPRANYVAQRVSAPAPKKSVSVSRTAAKPTAKPTAPKAPAKPVAPQTGLRIPAPTDTITPMVPDIESYLGEDTTFQDQNAQLRKAYAEFIANQNLDRNNYATNYALQLRNLDQSKTEGFANLQDDFAGRGLLKSGVYAKAYSDLQDQFASQQAQMDAAKAQFESGLTSALAGFQNDQGTSLTSAKQEAIARRAAKYNLGV